MSLSRDHAEVPGLLRLLWMLLMQPLELRRRLHSLDINEADAPGWKLWDGNPMQQVYLRRMIALTISTSLTLIFISAFLLKSESHISITDTLILGNTFGVLIGLILCLLSSPAIGFIWSFFWSTFTVVIANISSYELITSSMPSYAAFGIVLGCVLGISSNLANCFFLGKAISFTRGLIASVLVSLIPFLANSFTELQSAPDVNSLVQISILTGITFLISIFRLPIFPIEALLQIFLFIIQRTLSIQTIFIIPLLYHDLCYFPYPALARHLKISAEKNEFLVRKILRICKYSPGQSGNGRLTYSQLQATELSELGKQKRFSEAALLYGKWLPGRESKNTILIALKNAASRFNRAQDLRSSPHQALKIVAQGKQILSLLENELFANTSDHNRPFLTTLEDWITSSNELSERIKVEAENRIPNIFRYVKPLTPDRDKDIFYGRERTVKELINFISSFNKTSIISVISPRQSGKTSLLKMLPDLISNSLLIFIDLQNISAKSFFEFMQSIVRVSKDEARSQKQIELCDLPEGNIFEASKLWLESLESIETNHVIFCIDEFEVLSRIDTNELRHLLQLFWTRVRDSNKIRLVLAGATSLHDMGPPWNEGFLVYNEICLENFDQDTTCNFLRHPLEKLNEDIIPISVANAIFRKTGGQPYLLQCYAVELIDHLNHQGRRKATLEDLSYLDAIVRRQASSYFRTILSEAPENIQTVFQSWAQRESVELNRSQYRWLKRKALIKSDGSLSIGIFASWLDENL